MVVRNMDGAARERLLRLGRQKEDMEREIQELTLVLQANNVGMTEPLVDADGFPRSDLDVYRVRHARHRILCLRNDHTALMKQIEKGLHSLHSRILGTSDEGAAHHNGGADMDTSEPGALDDAGMSAVLDAAGSLTVNGHEMKPIVKVNLVSEGSPAENAGIKVDDEIIQFGSIDASNFRSLSQIGEVVQHACGSRVEVQLLRGGELLRVGLVPGPWAGRGLLGCNIVPVSI